MSRDPKIMKHGSMTTRICLASCSPQLGLCSRRRCCRHAGGRPRSEAVGPQRKALSLSCPHYRVKAFQHCKKWSFRGQPKAEPIYNADRCRVACLWAHGVPSTTLSPDHEPYLPSHKGPTVTPTAAVVIFLLTSVSMVQAQGDKAVVRPVYG
jgi:hypothetical protein